MRPLSPPGMIILGLVLMVLGVILPLFMILKIIPTGFILSFIAYGASFGGMILGFIGLVLYVRTSRRRWR